MEVLVDQRLGTVASQKARGCRLPFVCGRLIRPTEVHLLRVGGGGAPLSIEMQW